MTDTRFKPGQSGNPRGRPRRKSVAELVGAANMAKVIEAMVKAATEGDAQAAKLLVPPVKPELPRAEVPGLQEATTATQRGEAILKAAAAGQISPTAAEALSAALANVTRIAEVDELARQIATIEAKLKERGLL